MLYELKRRKEGLRTIAGHPREMRWLETKGM